MLDAARALLFRVGVENLTVQAIAEACGAPVGSLYNRFGSRRELLARLWLRAARKSQAAALPQFVQDDAVEVAVASARRVVTFAREEPEDARLLASFRREDLVGQELSPALLSELETLNNPVQVAYKQLCKRLYGDARNDRMRRMMLPVLDLPLAAIRRYVLGGRSVPAELEPLVERAARAILTDDIASAGLE